MATYLYNMHKNKIHMTLFSLVVYMPDDSKTGQASYAPKVRKHRSVSIPSWSSSLVLNPCFVLWSSFPNETVKHYMIPKTKPTKFLLRSDSWVISQGQW